MAVESARRRIVILGAGGRDFHNFNVAYRDDPAVEVVAFGATQIPGIADRRYPPSLAGERYPEGIPILGQEGLPDFCAREGVDEVVFAYSDIPHSEVMHVASRFLASGTDFTLLGPGSTMLRSKKTVIAVTAVRTGCGKSSVSRYVAAGVAEHGLRLGVLRHPMPYGDLVRQAVQRFATAEDLDAADCTIEEREEYQPYIDAGMVVFAGVDYERILEQAEAEADVILWDGGNNDFPFVAPDLHIVLADALRPGHETAYHPGETVLGMADHVLIMKVAGASPDAVQSIEAAVRERNADAGILHGDLEVTLDRPEEVRGKSVLVIEDGPTITHGGMATGAGHVGAAAAGAREIVDPRPYAVGDIAEAYSSYPHIGPVLPALGYYPEQLSALAETIAKVPAEVVVTATPAALDHLIETDKSLVRAQYAFVERDRPGLAGVLAAFCDGLQEAEERGGR